MIQLGLAGVCLKNFISTLQCYYKKILKNLLQFYQWCVVHKSCSDRILKQRVELHLSMYRCLAYSQVITNKVVFNGYADFLFVKDVCIASCYIVFYILCCKARQVPSVDPARVKIKGFFARKQNLFSNRVFKNIGVPFLRQGAYLCDQLFFQTPWKNKHNQKSKKKNKK